MESIKSIAWAVSVLGIVFFLSLLSLINEKIKFDKERIRILKEDVQNIKEQLKKHNIK